jgi:YdjC-like protein
LSSAHRSTRSPAPGSRRPIWTSNEFLDSYFLDIDDKPAQYARLLRDLPTGLSEWAVHPSVGSEESQAIDNGWRRRRTDYEFLTSPQARQLIEQQGVVVIDYRPIQRAWSPAERTPVNQRTPVSRTSYPAPSALAGPQARGSDKMA